MSDTLVLQGNTKQQRYESLVAALYQDVFRYAFWICKNKPLAENLVQETFLRAWRSLESHCCYKLLADLVGKKSPRYWVSTIIQ